MARIANTAKEDSLVIVCVSGGCTALATLPPNGITLDEVRLVFELLLHAGAPIEDQNAVRKHLSQLGGGKLSTLLRPAQTVGLIVSDEVSGLPWGPTVPDTTTFRDAINVLRKYDLWQKTPESVKKYFQEQPEGQETPKAVDFERSNLRCDNYVLADNTLLCQAAEVKAKQLKLNAGIITTKLEGEARAVGTVIGSIALEAEKNDRPFKKPCAIIAGGETTVTLGPDSGQGGRNQELALSAAIKIAGSKNITVASLGTDGTDGPTDIAGAIVDGYTSSQSEVSGVDLFENLKRHDSASACGKLSQAIFTNNTETNLMDLVVVCVL
jgi:glycerate 2-kinase